MINFRTIRWKNLLSTGNYFTEIQLDQHQNTLVVGDNGSGKSTLLDALCFALFGKAFRNINKPNLLNSINQKDCVVEVTFDTNGKSYKVVRGIKPNVFEIYQDNELMNQDASTRDYQEVLEKFILKLNYKSFTQIVILGSASFTPFMQLSAADRRAIIEDLLDIQIFSTMNGVVKDKMTNNKDLIATNKHQMDLLQQKYDLQKKHLDQLKENNEQKIKEYEKEIETNTATVEQIMAQIDMVSDQIDKLNDAVADKAETDAKVKKITKLESQIETNLAKIKKDIVFFQNHDDCPTCRQSIAQSFKESELVSLTAKSTECEHGLKLLEQKLSTEQEKLNKITEQQRIIQTKQVEIATKNTTISELNKYIKKLNKMILELRESKGVDDDNANELQEISNQLKDYKDSLKKLIDEKTYYEVAGNLLKDSGIKTKIVKQYLPVINKLVNKYLATLDFFVNFNLDESFKETIKSRHRDEFSYNNFSEGEKQRIDMALMLTWRAVAKLKNSSNTNLLILDEVFDSSLDVNGTEYLMNILHMLDGVNLFVISHKGDILQDKFANVIRFKKVKNFSKVIK
jgi:DNA repair exonuclease SbcCD ATPase subunit